MCVVSSPRPWGCFVFFRRLFQADLVFPTPVGVFPPDTATRLPFLCLPHARGGVSGDVLPTAKKPMSSPRPWGCFSCSTLKASLTLVFPTPVGVFPSRWPYHRDQTGLPHARGGVSFVHVKGVPQI